MLHQRMATHRKAFGIFWCENTSQWEKWGRVNVLRTKIMRRLFHGTLFSCIIKYFVCLEKWLLTFHCLTIYILNTNLFKSLHGLVHLMKVMHIWHLTGLKKIMLIKVHKREQELFKTGFGTWPIGRKSNFR